MKEFYWCRKKLETGEYYYIYVVKEAAVQIYQNVGYEINIDPKQIPEHIKEKVFND